MCRDTIMLPEYSIVVHRRDSIAAMISRRSVRDAGVKSDLSVLKRGILHREL